MRLSKGWIPLYREDFEKYFDRAPFEFHFYTWLLMNACHEAGEKWLDSKTKVNLERGEVLTSVRDATKKTGLHHRTLRKVCENLKAKGLISITSKEPFVIRLCQFEHAMEIKKGGRRPKQRVTIDTPDAPIPGIGCDTFDTPDAPKGAFPALLSYKNNNDIENDNITESTSAPVLDPSPSAPGGAKGAVDLELVLPDFLPIEASSHQDTKNVPLLAQASEVIPLLGSKVAMQQNRNKPAKKENSIEGGGRGAEVWENYADAYQKKYGKTPPRNATANTQAKTIWQRLGEDAFAVVRFYVHHTDRYYVQQKHPLGCVTKDWHRVWCDWKDGSSVSKGDAQFVEKRAATRKHLDLLKTLEED